MAVKNAQVPQAEFRRKKEAANRDGCSNQANVFQDAAANSEN
jgi:hypothetical protein